MGPEAKGGGRFNDVIEKALKESNCVVVMWSKLSVESQYVKHEANYALRRNKLVPVMIEEVELPFRFEDLHTLSLLGWDGSKDFSEFRRLVEDISAIVGPATKHQEAQPADRQESKLEPGKIFRDKLKGGKGGSTRLPSVKQPKSKLNPGTVFRDKLKDGSQGPEMVVIPAGTFRMGDTNSDGTEVERPVHPVRISRPFAMGRYEVTFEEYDQFAAATGRELPRDEGWGRGRSPVINVSWNEAMDYAEWLSQQTIKPYRLPTEAEWEYAVRAGTETAYWWGNEMKSGMANCNDGSSKWSGKQTAQVGSFKPNPFGMHDMAGNVREWVQDCWHDNYNSAPADSSAWKEEGGGKCGQREVRGGSWTRTPGHLRSSYRIRFVTDARGYDIGFRLAQDLD